MIAFFAAIWAFLRPLLIDAAKTIVTAVVAKFTADTISRMQAA